MSKVHCILCDRKDPLMWHIRLPRNKITVPVCTKCADKFDFWHKEPVSLKDVIEPVVIDAVNTGVYIREKYGDVINDIRKHLKDNEDCGECQECVYGVPKDDGEYFCSFHDMNMHKDNTCDDYKNKEGR